MTKRLTVTRNSIGDPKYDKMLEFINNFPNLNELTLTGWFGYDIGI